VSTLEHPLEAVLAERIAAGLRRKTITSCSKWAEEYRIMGQPFPGPWRFNFHPWIRAMHDDPAEMVIGQKGAQLGFTETALNKVFYAIDVLGVSVLYVLPAATPDASDFSTSRFDPALESSTHIQHLFSNVKNIGHKRAGNANLFIRGSRSRSQLKSLPVGLIVLDEVDEMKQENVPLAFERASGQVHKQNFLISTPTIDLYGINEYYQRSTQAHWIFKCPHCSKRTTLEFPDCLVITADKITDVRLRETHLICKECQHKLDHEAKREWLADASWVHSFPDRDISGYHINQLYSTTVRPDEIAGSYLRAQTNPADEQEFYNSKLGLTHTVEGAKIVEKDIQACIGTFKKYDEAPRVPALITMGIDVGKWLHYEIDQWVFDDSENLADINLIAHSRLINEGKCLDFEELDLLMQKFRVHFCVIDANPERRKALEFAQRFWGRVKLCFYARGISSKNIHVHQEEEHTISVDRTSWMDLAFNRLRSRKISLPIDISQEWQAHIKAPVRVYKKDPDGNPIGIYVTGNEDDHFAHARTYTEMALPLGATLMKSHNISGVL
jgi:hypothetical protein